MHTTTPPHTTHTLTTPSQPLTTYHTPSQHPHNTPQHRIPPHITLTTPSKHLITSHNTLTKPSHHPHNTLTTSQNISNQTKQVFLQMLSSQPFLFRFPSNLAW